MHMNKAQKKRAVRSERPALTFLALTVVCLLIILGGVSVALRM
jgi:hypothetical protein